jgi:hypothetical protein
VRPFFSALTIMAHSCFSHFTQQHPCLDLGPHPDISSVIDKLVILGLHGVDLRMHNFGGGGKGESWEESSLP